jgi:hypothetical protein
MIAYNYHIKFIPELKHDKKVEGSFTDTIEVKERTYTNLEKKLKQEMPFYNNQGRELSLYTDREFDRTVKGQLWVFEIKGVVTFFWHSGSLRIEYFQQENFTQDLLEYWCLHIALPIFFIVEEIYEFLHAGAVEIDGKPVLFVAESMGGKSTITDYFIKQGHTMISDDKVPILETNDSFLAIPSHPHHRPYRKMEDLGLFVKNFAIEAKPVDAIYELERADKDAKIEITELQGIEKYKSLHYADLMSLFFLRPKKLSFLMRMAKGVPVLKVTVPWDIDRLDELYESIVEYTEKITTERLS